MSQTIQAQPSQTVADEGPGLVSVIAQDQHRTENASWSSKIELRRDAILSITANAFGNCDIRQLPEPRPTSVNAGVGVEIWVDGELWAKGQTFEAQAETVNLFSTAASSRFVRRGTRTLQIKRIEEGTINNGTALEVAFHAVGARSFG